MFLITLMLYLIVVLYGCLDNFSLHQTIEKVYIVKYEGIHIDNKDVYLGSVIFILIMDIFFVIPLT